MGGSGGNNAVPPPLPKKMNKVIIIHVHLSMQMGALQISYESIGDEINENHNFDE